MKWVFTVLCLLSVIFGIGCGRLDAVNSAAISECVNAVQLGIFLCGGICLWSGIMYIAEKSGLTEHISKALSFITTRIFHGIDKSSKAMHLITMNLTANLLGLGNAATPLGISAMAELSKTSPTASRNTANDNMILFVVLNTASIQLIPTTIALLRNKYGAADPLDILPAVLLSSFLSVTVGILLAKSLNRLFPICPDSKEK